LLRKGINRPIGEKGERARERRGNEERERERVVELEGEQPLEESNEQVARSERRERSNNNILFLILIIEASDECEGAGISFLLRKNK
jgi:hypothetical protein